MEAGVWVAVQGLEYRIVDDGTWTAQAVGVARMVDELSDAPPHISVDVDWPNLWATTPGGGVFCIAGNVALAFPDLATTAYDVPVVVHAEGCSDVALIVHIPAAAAFPLAIAAPALRRDTMRVRGRVVGRAGSGAPIAGARVFAVDETGTPPGPGSEHALVLRTPLRFAHDALTPVRVRALAPPGAGYAVDAAAAPGDDIVMLDTRTALTVGDLLRLGDEATWEFAVIRALPPIPTNPADPGPVQLWGGLLRGAARTTPVRAVPRGAVGGAVAKLQRSAARGDGLLVLDLHLEDATIEVLDADPDHVEYAAVGALSDALGYYRVDGVGRVRTSFFRASHAAFTASPPTPCSLDLERPETLLDFRLNP
jgi:hypothetical protein